MICIIVYIYSDELFILMKDAPVGTRRLPSNIGGGNSPHGLIEKTLEVIIIIIILL